jgi:voltage-dependent anion channel protein 2
LRCPPRFANSRIQLLNKDFYHLSAGTIEVKSNTPNNVAFKVTGKSSHDNATSGAVCLGSLQGA